MSIEKLIQTKRQIELGDRIRQLRLENSRPNMQMFANEIGISRALYNNYERGRANPTFRNICKLCDAFNVTLHEFFNYESK